MSVRVMARVWEEAREVKGGALLVLLALSDYADDGGRCWPSIPMIAEKARLTERQTRRVILELEAVGHLKRSTAKGQRTSYVVIPTPVKMSGQNVRADISTADIRDSGPRTSATGPRTSTASPPTPPHKEEPPVVQPPELQPPSSARGAAKKASKPRPIKGPLPDDWRPKPDHVEMARAAGIDGPTEEARFRDYAAGHGWRMVDWDATFRNWLRKAADRAPAATTNAVAVRNGNGAPMSTASQRSQQALEAARRIRERDH